MSRAEARHLLDRFTFGPRPAELEETKATSAEVWMAHQLAPQAIADAAADEKVAPYNAVLSPPAELREAYMKEFRRPKSTTGVLVKKAVDSRRLIEDAQMVQFLRQVASERQVLEVMVDFWFNHFNVYALKGEPVKVLVTDYIERTIRPNALGRFEDLLIATARHPAMLVYLDNHRSSVAKSGTTRGITENYARELLELHTLGVHGGYTQQDVIEVARILTGWTIKNLGKKSYAFEFKPYMHDVGAKVVLGVTYPAKRGEEEGVELLRQLAAHPATARRLATKLCIRFVHDTPPPGCVEQLSSAYTTSRGDISTLLKTLVTLPDFWAHARSRLKSPNLFLVSTYRALGTLPKDAAEHAKLATPLGEPKLLQPAPTGYLDDAQWWASTASMLNRINFALTVTETISEPGGQLDDQQIVERVNQQLFAGLGSQATLDTLRTQVAEVPGVRQKLQTALALGLASPDFQYH